MPAALPARTAGRIGDAIAYLWPLLAVLLLVKLGQVFLYPTPYLIADTGEFLESARSLQPNPYKPIGYSLFLAGCRIVAPAPIGVAICQSGLRLVATAFLGLALRGYGWPRWAVLAVVIVVGCDLQALLLDHYLLSDSLFTSLTVGFLALILIYARRGSRSVWVATLVVALVAISVRFVGLLYPAVLIAVLWRTGGQARWWRMIATTATTTLLLVGLSAQMWRQFGVFRYTTFDGWAFYGNAAALLDLDRDHIGRIEDEETRLCYEYLASFPPEDSRRDNTNWHRWSPQSPAKQLLFAFWSVRPPDDPAAGPRNRRFLGQFMELADPPTTRVQRLYHRLRTDDPALPPYFMEYRDAFVFTNELLRLVNREFMRHRAVHYLTGFFLASFAAAIIPPPLQNGGRYTERTEPDRAVSAFWPGTDTSTWGPRYGDVLGPVFAAYRILVPLTWLLALTVIAGRLWQRGTLENRDRGGMGPWVFVVAVVYAVAVAFSHHTETRYLAPIMPLVVVGTALTVWGRDTSRGAVPPTGPETHK